MFSYATIMGHGHYTDWNGEDHLRGSVNGGPYQIPHRVLLFLRHLYFVLTYLHS